MCDIFVKHIPAFVVPHTSFSEISMKVESISSKCMIMSVLAELLEME